MFCVLPDWLNNAPLSAALFSLFADRVHLNPHWFPRWACYCTYCALRWWCARKRVFSCSGRNRPRPCSEHCKITLHSRHTRSRQQFSPLQWGFSLAGSILAPNHNCVILPPLIFSLSKFPAHIFLLAKQHYFFWFFSHLAFLLNSHNSSILYPLSTF